MASSIFAFHTALAAIDYGAVGGWLLFLDLVLFTTLSVFWDVAGQTSPRFWKRRRSPMKRRG